jgi:hypothetical protein
LLQFIKESINRIGNYNRCTPKERKNYISWASGVRRTIFYGHFFQASTFILFSKLLNQSLKDRKLVLLIKAKVSYGPVRSLGLDML